MTELIYFVAGLAIFLYAMRTLELGLRRAGGARFKRWIALRTHSRLNSVAYGVLVTAILQSSSMVSLIVLAFLSAEVISLTAAIGIMLGANLGTTLTGWVVTVVGFKMDFQALVIPLLGLGALSQLFLSKREKLSGIGLSLFAFGLLIYGLDLMKSGVVGLPELIDFSAIAALPSIVFLLLGVFLAAAMQSSSAVMVITLSLLSTELLSLPSAAAIVIGADLGTTSTTVLGSLGGAKVKQQLAFAHVFFNLLINTLAFLILLPLLPQLLALAGITDPLVGLVAFHSTFNLLGIVLFVPILGVYSHWVERLIPAPRHPLADYFLVPVEAASAAIDALSAALQQLKSDALHLHLEVFNLTLAECAIKTDALALKPASSVGDFAERYGQLKRIEGDFIRYAERLLQTQLTHEQRLQVSQMADSARAMVYATKTLNDIRGDWRTLNSTLDLPLNERLKSIHTHYVVNLLGSLLPIMMASNSTQTSFALPQRTHFMSQNNHHRERANQVVAEQIPLLDYPPEVMSTWFNLNHEVHHYVRYLLAVIPGESTEL